MNDNIFFLYNKLKNNGQKSEAVKFISDVCNVRVTTIKNHWLRNKEFPKYVLEDSSKVNVITEYLQNLNYKNSLEK